MKICFYSGDPFWGGLANNGGTRTILKSAEVLRALGHRVDVVATADRFKWFDHPKVLHKIPKDADAVVAISVSDIKHMHRHAKGMRMFYWARGWETWQIPEEKLFKRLRAGQTNIANSSGLQKRIEAVAPCELCWAGMDFPKVKPYGILGKIGFLGRTIHKSKRYDLCEKLIKELSTREFKILKGIKEDQRAEFFGDIACWFAPTESEGFHNPPAEACMYGAFVVCNRLPNNGMTDYATDETAVRYDTFDEALEAVKSDGYQKGEKMREVLKEKIGSREKNMKMFVEVLSK